MNSQNHKKGAKATLGMWTVFVGHPGLQMPTYLFYNSWHNVFSLCLHTNFGVGAASWSYFPYFLGFRWMKQSELFPGVAVGVLSPGYIFSPSPELNGVWQKNSTLIFSIRITPSSVTTCLIALHDLTKCISMNWLLGLLSSKACVATILLPSQLAPFFLLFSFSFFPSSFWRYLSTIALKFSEWIREWGYDTSQTE